MTEINWNVSDEDHRLIRRIADRAMATMPSIAECGYSHLDVVMDVQATHANGNPLDLARLLNDFRPFDFSHDIVGILTHLDRKTGKLTGCFSPRCTLPRHDPAAQRTEAARLIESAKDSA